MRALFAIDVEEEDMLEGVLGAGRALLERLDATVDLLHVDTFVPVVVLPEGDEAGDRWLDARTKQRDAALQRRVEQLLERWPAARRGRAIVERDARPADRIAARAVGHDLVAVGTHGRQGLTRLWLGSVAEKVVRSSPAPVLVVRPVREGPDPRVLVGVDVFDDGAEALLADAGRWATRLGARLDATHVVAPPISPDPSVFAYGGAWAAELGVLERSARERLEQLHALLPADVRGAARIELGDPGATLAAAADTALAVIVRTHGRRGLGRLALGSVAERVVRRAPVPVLVLPRAP